MQISIKRLIVWSLIISGLLLIPFIVMQLSSEVNWDLSDFAIMGFMLAGVAILYEFIAIRSVKSLYRTAFGIGLFGAFLLAWVNGAVGIIGSEDQEVNLMFGAVFIVGLVGALISRFKAKGMAFTLFIAAITQLLVPSIALIIWPPTSISWSPGILGVFLMCAVFSGIFVLSAYLFMKASRQ